MVIIPTRFACYLSTTGRLALLSLLIGISIVILVARDALSMEWTYRRIDPHMLLFADLSIFQIELLDDLQHSAYS